VEAIGENGDVYQFGKDDDKGRPPRIGTGLLGLDETY